MILLKRLGSQYRTDKVVHNYLPHYATAFGPSRFEYQRVLELGVFYGGSIQMWRDFFPNAEVTGVDTFSAAAGFSHLSPKDATKFLDAWKAGTVGPRIQLVRANQSDVVQLAGLATSLVARRQGAPRRQFDLVVEDGSHLQRDQQLALGYLLPLVKPGGAFVIEDIHSGLQSGYDEPAGSANTTFVIMAEFNRTRRMRSRHLAPAQLSYLERWMRSASTIQAWSKGVRKWAHQTCIIHKRTREEVSHEVQKTS